MDTLLQDVRYAARRLRKSPGFTAAAVLTLALGIGANSAIFSAVNGVLLRPLPYREPERLVMLWTHLPGFGREVSSLPDYRDWRDQNTVFAELAAASNAEYNLTSDTGDPERTSGYAVTANFFRTMGVAPALGRGFLPDEERQAGAPPRVVMLGYRLWQRRFGGQPGAIGQTITLNGIPRTIVGVMPAGFRFRSDADIWVPLATDREAGRRGDYLAVVGRLEAGLTVDRAQSEMATIARRLAAQYPQSNTGVGIDVVPLKDQIVGPIKPALLVFSGAVGLVLLIACANVANLMLARAAAREREMAVRAALGASRGRIVGQLLTESLLVALLGGALGLLLAFWGIEALRTAKADLIPRLNEVGIDPRVLAFTFALSLATGLMFGLAPSLQLARDLYTPLRSGRGMVGGGAGVQHLRRLLVLAEVALALVLLVGAGLLIRSFDRLQRVDAGFDPTGVATARVALPPSQYRDDEARRTFFARLLERLEASPGVAAVGAASDVPLSGGTNYLSFSIGGRPGPAPGTPQDAQTFSVTAGYFRALRIPLIAGRTFTAQDNASAPRVALVNRTMARRYWAGQSPIGSRITFGNPDDSTGWMTVVGVVGDTRQTELSADAYAQAYAPYAQEPASGAYLVVRAGAAGGERRLASAIREAVREIDPRLPMYDVQTMAERVAGATTQPRVNMALLAVFAIAALILAATGIYGVMSYTVAQRTNEIGIRMALGAQPRDVLRLVIGQGMAPAVAGIAVGVLGALAVTRLMASLLFGVQARDPATFGGVTLFLAAVALLATYLPARRATRVDPLRALRSE